MARRKQTRLPLDPSAWGPVTLLGALTIAGFTFAWGWLWVPAGLLLLATVWFFRDPPRPPPRVPGAVLSPADGRVTAITTNEDPEAGPVGGPCVSIFLSVLNVHVTRCPCAGTVESMHYEPGRFLNAMNPASSRENESNWIWLRCGAHRLTVRQIAGLIARRIVCRVARDQPLRRGQRIGIIRFGSRVELYLPPESRVAVDVGQNVQGARTIVAYLPEEK